MLITSGHRAAFEVNSLPSMDTTSLAETLNFFTRINWFSTLGSAVATKAEERCPHLTDSRGNQTPQDRDDTHDMGTLALTPQDRNGKHNMGTLALIFTHQRGPFAFTCTTRCA
eukprot:3655818-Rhodomonas_salina.2